MLSHRRKVNGLGGAGAPSTMTRTIERQPKVGKELNEITEQMVGGVAVSHKQRK